MLIEELLFEIWYKKDSLKLINNYIIEECDENWIINKNNKEIYDKLISLLHANASLIDSIENILNRYQEKVELHYSELLKSEIPLK